MAVNCRVVQKHMSGEISQLSIAVVSVRNICAKKIVKIGRRLLQLHITCIGECRRLLRQSVVRQVSLLCDLCGFHHSIAIHTTESHLY